MTSKKNDQYRFVIDKWIHTLSKESLERFPESKLSKELLSGTAGGGGEGEGEGAEEEEIWKVEALSHMDDDIFAERIRPIYEGYVDAIIAMDENDISSYQLGTYTGLPVRVPLGSILSIQSVENRSLISHKLYKLIVESSSIIRSKGAGLNEADVHVPHIVNQELIATLSDEDWNCNCIMNMCMTNENIQYELKKKFNQEGIKLIINRRRLYRSDSTIQTTGHCDWYKKINLNFFSNGYITTFTLIWGAQEINNNLSSNNNNIITGKSTCMML